MSERNYSPIMSDAAAEQQNNSTVNLEESQNAGRPLLKNGAYSIRCISAEKGKSRKGNEMITYKFEIVAPATVKVSIGEGVEKEVPITGLQLTDWVVFNDLGFARMKGMHKAMGLSMLFDKKNPNVKQYVGKAVKVALTTNTEVAKDDNTGEPMLDESGNPVTTYNYRVQRYISADTENTLPADSVAF